MCIDIFAILLDFYGFVHRIEYIIMNS